MHTVLSQGHANAKKSHFGHDLSKAKHWAAFDAVSDLSRQYRAKSLDRGWLVPLMLLAEGGSRGRHTSLLKYLPANGWNHYLWEILQHQRFLFKAEYAHTYTVTESAFAPIVKASFGSPQSPHTQIIQHWDYFNSQVCNTAVSRFLNRAPHYT